MNEAGVVGAEGRDRTGDTTIFSRVLYQLSYLGANPNLEAAIRRHQPRPQRWEHRRFASPGIVPGHDLSDNIGNFVHHLPDVNPSLRGASLPYGDCVRGQSRRPDGQLHEMRE